ncbi:hypothetical protein PR048_003147 [Dryococelus australis]|uniref:Ig-like domain-containing protein n=1 Tax=Dryococelus australis TaxID=614101 RepID=A0ABQ9IMA5_9NEOP|nr:hypothetical protein PR048_003147 [Dryococelus australis]
MISIIENLYRAETLTCCTATLDRSSMSVGCVIRILLMLCLYLLSPFLACPVDPRTLLIPFMCSSASLHAWLLLLHIIFLSIIQCSSDPPCASQIHHVLLSPISCSSDPPYASQIHPVLLSHIPCSLDRPVLLGSTLCSSDPPCAPRIHHVLLRPTLCSSDPPCASQIHHVLLSPISCSTDPPCASQIHHVLLSPIPCSSDPPCAPRTHPVPLRPTLCSSVLYCAPQTHPVLSSASTCSLFLACASNVTPPLISWRHYHVVTNYFAINNDVATAYVSFLPLSSVWLRWRKRLKSDVKHWWPLPHIGLQPDEQCNALQADCTPVQCIEYWDTDIGCAQPSRSVYSIFSAWRCRLNTCSAVYVRRSKYEPPLPNAAPSGTLVMRPANYFVGAFKECILKLGLHYDAIACLLVCTHHFTADGCFTMCGSSLLLCICSLGRIICVRNLVPRHQVARPICIMSSELKWRVSWAGTGATSASLISGVQNTFLKDWAQLCRRLEQRELQLFCYRVIRTGRRMNVRHIYVVYECRRSWLVQVENGCQSLFYSFTASSLLAVGIFVFAGDVRTYWHRVFSSSDSVWYVDVLAARFVLVAWDVYYVLTAHPPEITLRPRDQQVKAGGIAAFYCVARGDPPPALQWRKNGKRVSGTQSRYLVHEFAPGGAMLRIDPVRSGRDNATYECVAENGVGDAVSAEANLRVYEGEYLTSFFSFACPRRFLHLCERRAETQACSEVLQSELVVAQCCTHVAHVAGAVTRIVDAGETECIAATHERASKTHLTLQQLTTRRWLADKYNPAGSNKSSRNPWIIRVERSEYGAVPECKGGGNGRSPGNPADQRHRSARTYYFNLLARHLKCYCANCAAANRIFNATTCRNLITGPTKPPLPGDKQLPVTTKHSSCFDYQLRRFRSCIAHSWGLEVYGDKVAAYSSSVKDMESCPLRTCMPNELHITKANGTGAMPKAPARRTPRLPHDAAVTFAFLICNVKDTYRRATVPYMNNSPAPSRWLISPPSDGGITVLLSRKVEGRLRRGLPTCSSSIVRATPKKTRMPSSNVCRTPHDCWRGGLARPHQLEEEKPILTNVPEVEILPSYRLFTVKCTLLKALLRIYLHARPPRSLFKLPYKTTGEPHPVVIDFRQELHAPLGIANSSFQPRRTISAPRTPISTATAAPPSPKDWVLVQPAPAATATESGATLTPGKPVAVCKLVLRKPVKPTPDFVSSRQAMLLSLYTGRGPVSSQ